MPDLSNTTALASELLKGKTAYSQNKKITGTLELNANQVVAGTEEIKRIYMGVPNDMEISTEISDIQKYTTTVQTCNFIDKDFPFMAFYYESDKDTINIYTKDKFLVQTLDYYTDSGNSAVRGASNFMMNLSKFLVGNTVITPTLARPQLRGQYESNRTKRRTHRPPRNA